MTNQNFENHFGIYLFTNPDEENQFSKLSEFISYLKSSKAQLPYKFSYVGRSETLIPDLTLNENILMDFSPDSLTAAREYQFQDFLSVGPGHYLENLYRKVSLPHELPVHSDSQMKKVSSLIKSFISDGQFIFLEEPEKDLDRETFKIFIDVLKEQIKTKKQNVFIFTNNLDLWSSHATFMVKRRNDYSFYTYKIIENSKISHRRKPFQFLIHTPKNQFSPLNENIIYSPNIQFKKKSAA